VKITGSVIGMETKKLLTTVVVFAVVLAAMSTIIEAQRGGSGGGSGGGGGHHWSVNAGSENDNVGDNNNVGNNAGNGGMGGHHGRQDVSVSTDKKGYITNTVIFEGIKVKVINNLNNSIYFYSGCADPALDIYTFENGKWSKPTPEVVCGAMPRVNELKPKQEITLGVAINEEGRYKVSFSYSLTKEGKWRIGNQSEVFSNVFTMTSIIPTLDNSLELCEERGDFSSIGGVHYPYYNCIASVAIWIADEDADKAIELCDKASEILGQQDYTCYQFIAEKISKYDKDKAIEICNTIEYPNQKDVCFKRIE
jgi:hypothetical protein